MLKFGDWINRKRHNGGYGIQSPSSFFFVTQVLKERLPYYAYPTLDKLVGGNRRKRRHFRELFRITNYHRPTSCIMKKVGEIGMLYVNATDDAHAIVRAALPYTNKNSVIIVDGLNRSKAVHEWWQQLVDDSATVVTYDMYSYGILLFDKERIKQHYTLKK